MPKQKTKQVLVLAQVTLPKEAIRACMRLMGDDNPYPGLRFTGSKLAYKRLRDDIDLVAGTLGKIIQEIMKQAEQGENYEN